MNDDCCEPTEPLRVEARAGLSVWIEFCDGSSGTVDLSHMADGPAFVGWQHREFFESVHINHEYGAIEWGDDVQLCPDALYLDLTGKSAEEVFPVLQAATTDAGAL